MPRTLPTLTDMSITAADSARRLEEVRASGELASLCERHGIELLMHFGSSLSRGEPRDVDVAVGFAAGAGDLRGVVEALAALIPGDHLDVMDLDRAGAVARQRALVGGRVLYSSSPAAFSERELWAVREYMETAPRRRALLQELAR